MNFNGSLFHNLSNFRAVKITAIVLSGFMLMAGNAQASGNAPAALALDIIGTTVPPVEPFTELDRKQKIQLDAETTMEFMHYASCQSVTIKGGRLSFSKQRYFLKGGKILDTQRAECPKSVALKGASQIGGVVLRSSRGGSTVRASLKPSFVLLGGQGGEYKLLRVTQGNKTLLEGEIKGRVFHWPGSASALQKGKTYAISLIPGSGGKPRVFMLKARPTKKKGAMTLIRLD
jgi:hypothetical protein